MKIKAFLFFILFSFGLFSIQAQEKKGFDSTILSEAGKTAYQKLLSAGVFSIGGVGYGGKISDEEQSMKVLLTEQNSIAALKDLVINATPEGGLYGLAGLYVKDFQTFNDQSLIYLKRDLPANRKITPPNANIKGIPQGFVVEQAGCLVGVMEAKMIIERIEAGKYGWNLQRYVEQK